MFATLHTQLLLSAPANLRVCRVGPGVAICHCSRADTKGSQVRHLAPLQASSMDSLELSETALARQADSTASTSQSGQQQNSSSSSTAQPWQSRNFQSGASSAEQHPHNGFWRGSGRGRGAYSQDVNRGPVQDGTGPSNGSISSYRGGYQGRGGAYRGRGRGSRGGFRGRGRGSGYEAPSRPTTLFDALGRSASLKHLMQLVERQSQHLDATCVSYALHRMVVLARAKYRNQRQGLTNFYLSPGPMRLLNVTKEQLPNLHDKALSNTLTAVAEMVAAAPSSGEVEEVLLAVARRAQPKLEALEWGPLEVVWALWACRQARVLRQKVPGLLRAVLGAVAAHIDAFHASQLTMLVRDCAELGIKPSSPEHGPVVGAVLDVCARHAQQMTTRQLAMTMRSLGQMRYTERDTLLVFTEALQAQWLELTTSDAVKLLSACSMTHLADPELLAAIEAHLVQYAGNIRARHFRDLSWAYVTLNLRPGEELLQALAAVMQKQLPVMACDWVGHFVWSMAKVGAQLPPAVLDEAADLLISRAHQNDDNRTTSQSLTLYLWASASMGHSPPHLDELLQVVHDRMEEWSVRDLYSLLQALALLGIAPPRLMPALYQHVLHMMPQLDSQGMAAVVWGLAKLGCEEEALLDALAARAERMLDTLAMRDILEIVWSYARLGYTKALPNLLPLFGRMEEDLQQDDARWSMRDLASAAWTLGQLQSGATVRLAGLIQHRSLPRLPEAKGIDLANLLWGLARLRCGITAPAQRAFTERAVELAGVLTAREVATVLWSWGSLEAGTYLDASALDPLLTAATHDIASYTTQSVANITWACGKLLHMPRGYLEAVRAEVLRRPAAFALTEWSAIIWGFSRLGQDPAELYDVLEAELEAGRLQLDPKLISSAMWSLAIFDGFSRPLYARLQAALRRLSTADFEPKSLRCVLQAHLLAVSTGQSVKEDLPEEFRWQARSIWRDTMNCHDSPRDFLTQVSEALLRVDVKHVTNYPTDDDLFILDIALDTHKKIAVEAAGSPKLVRNTGELAGRMLYRKRMLEQYGWTVAVVKWNDWAPLDRSGQEDYLMSVARSLGILHV